MEPHFNWEEISVDEQKKAHALQQIHLAASLKKTVYTPSLYRLFLNQLHYISKQYWIMQSGFMLFILFVLKILNYLHTDFAGMLHTLTLFVSLLGIIGMTEINRSISCNMMELEQTCFFGSRQLFCIRMILFGSIDLLFLTCLILMNRMNAQLISFGLYLIVPFIFSNVCYLMIFILTRGINPVYTYFLAGVFVGAFTLITTSLPGVCSAANTGIWFAVFGLSVAGLVLEIRHILLKLNERELLCMNYR